MKIVPGGYGMYQNVANNHQQQQTASHTQPPPSYFETQFQRNTPIQAGQAAYGLSQTSQQSNQQRCPIHQMQPCNCQMVNFHSDFQVYFI